MGLDISYYRQAKFVRAPADDDDGYNEGLVRIYTNPDFAERADRLADGLYSAEFGDDFRAGSYSGYNRWREELARFAGYPPTRHDGGYGGPRDLCAAACWEGATGPFSELINFADNEGVIGPITAGKLARDFAEWDARAKAHQGPLGEWFYESYCQWRKAFETAADAGFVSFH